MGLFFVTGCAPERAIEAIRLLVLLGGDGTGGREPGISRESVTYAVKGRAYPADLYTARDGAKANLVLVPGLTPAGRRDARLTTFARQLAAADFRVLVPEVPNFRKLTVTADDTSHFIAAIRYLARDGDTHRPVGVAAISFAVGPALMAAQDATIREDVAFVLSIGGYYDLSAVITFFTTGYFRDRDGEWRYRRPNSYGKWVFVRSNASRIADSADAALLDGIAARKLADPAADVSDLTRRLGPSGRAVMALVRNDEPARTAALIEALPAGIRRQIRALDVSRHGLDDLKARLVLVHGQTDSIIPAGESRALASAAPVPAHLYLLDNLEHAVLGDIGVAEAVTLWRATYRVLTLRDRMAAG